MNREAQLFQSLNHARTAVVSATADAHIVYAPNQVPPDSQARAKDALALLREAISQFEGAMGL